MSKLLRGLAVMVMAIWSHTAWGATTLAGSNTFVDLLWNLSGSGATGCTQILADATGDASRSTRVTIYGTVNCPSIGVGFPMTGVAYVSPDGLFNLQFNLGYLVVTCPGLVRASGSCKIASATGENRGNLTVTLVP